MVLAGALLVGTAGCTFVSKQATLIQYDPSDGIGATVGDVKLSNVIALASHDGKAFSLLVTFFNSGLAPATVTLQFESGGEKTTVTELLGARQTLSFGNKVGEPQIIILNPGVKTGALFPVYVQTGAVPGQQLLVPVLPADAPPYDALKPPEVLRKPVPTASSTAGSTATPTPQPTATTAP